MKMKNFILTICLLGLTAGVYQPKADAGVKAFLNNYSGTIAIVSGALCGSYLFELYLVCNTLKQLKKNVSMIKKNSELSSNEEAIKLISILQNKIKFFTSMKRRLIVRAGISGICALGTGAWFMKTAFFSSEGPHNPHLIVNPLVHPEPPVVAQFTPGLRQPRRPYGGWHAPEPDYLVKQAAPDGTQPVAKSDTGA